MKKTIKWIKRIIVTILSLIMVVLIALWVSFYFWKNNVTKNLPNDTKVISTENGKIEYALDGNADKYMLLVHGSPGSVHVSRLEAVSTYLDKGFSILSVSRPGYYQTPLSSGKTVKEQAALFRSLLKELGIDSVYVNGVSGGGPSSIQFAIDYPELCSGLILRAAVSEKEVITDDESGNDESNLVDNFFETEFVIWLGMQIALRQIDDELFKDNLVLYMKNGMFPFDKIKEGHANDFNQFTNLEDLQLEKIQAPTIIMHGNKDKNVPFSFAENASKRIPNATLFEMKEKNHSVFFTSFNDTINQEIYQFIDSIEGNQN